MAVLRFYNAFYQFTVITTVTAAVPDHHANPLRKRAPAATFIFFRSCLFDRSRIASLLALSSPSYLLAFYFLFTFCLRLLSFISLFPRLCPCRRHLLFLPFPFSSLALFLSVTSLALVRDTNTRINSRLEPRRRHPIIAGRNFIKCALCLFSQFSRPRRPRSIRFSPHARNFFPFNSVVEFV